MTTFTRIFPDKVALGGLTQACFDLEGASREELVPGKPVKFISLTTAVLCKQAEKHAIVAGVAPYDVNKGMPFGTVLWITEKPFAAVMSELMFPDEETHTSVESMLPRWVHQIKEFMSVRLSKRQYILTTYPEVGSQWRHSKSGDMYTVEGVYNLTASRRIKYPVTVAYRRVSDDTLWCRPFSAWWMSFDEVDVRWERE